MSERGSFIIRHEFVQAWTDKDAARTFVFKTIERLKEYFHLQEPDEYFEYEEDDYGDLPPSFELPLYDAAFYLYNDFWEVFHGYNYWNIMYKSDGDFGLEEMHLILLVLWERKKRGMYRSILQSQNIWMMNGGIKISRWHAGWMSVKSIMTGLYRSLIVRASCCEMKRNYVTIAKKCIMMISKTCSRS